jgi:hypothetical protein
VVPGGMADLAAALALAASGWWDRPLRRLGLGRGPAVAVGAAALAGALCNLDLPGPVAGQLNLGGSLPAAGLLAAALVWPERRVRILTAAAGPTALCFALAAWHGWAADLAVAAAAAGAALALAGRGRLAVLAAAAAPALAAALRWGVALADGLPGPVWVGGGDGFTVAVLAATAAGAMAWLLPAARDRAAAPV